MRFLILKQVNEEDGRSLIYLVMPNEHGLFDVKFLFDSSSEKNETAFEREAADICARHQQLQQPIMGYMPAWYDLGTDQDIPQELALMVVHYTQHTDQPLWEDEVNDDDLRKFVEGEVWVITSLNDSPTLVLGEELAKKLAQRWIEEDEDDHPTPNPQDVTTYRYEDRW